MWSENEVIRHCDLDKINCYLQSANNNLLRKLENLTGKYGTPAEINARAAEAGKVENLMKRLSDMDSPYLPDVEWLIKIRDKGAFRVTRGIILPRFGLRQYPAYQNNQKLVAVIIGIADGYVVPQMFEVSNEHIAFIVMVKIY